MIGRMVKRRLLWWAIGAGGGCLAPTLGFGFLLLLVVSAFFMVFGGLGYHAQKTPPPLPTEAVYSGQWLTLVQHVDTANKFFTQFPAVLWIGAMSASSGGMPLDRAGHGGYGLFDLPHKTNMGHPLAATNAFALDLREHQRTQDLQATLNAVGNTLAPSQANWSQTVRSAVNSLEQGPEIAAWPVLTQWSRTAAAPASSRFGASSVGGTVQWNYPTRGKTLLTATATAPVGNPFAVPWTPPTRDCTPPPPHSHKKPACHVVHHDLTGRDVEGPTSMSVKLSNGQVVPMMPIHGPSSKDGFVYAHDILYVTTHRVLVNAQHPATITARWPGGVHVSVTLPGSGFASGSMAGSGFAPGGPLGPAPPPGNAKSLDQIWSADRSFLMPAAQQAHMPVGFLVSEGYWESRGIDFPYAGPNQACGMFQMFSPGSFTTYAPAGTPVDACDVGSVEAEAAAGYLSALYQQFGSWRIAIAGYYGGSGTVESSGVRPGMPWSQAAKLLNWVPAPGAGNTETMTYYAEQSYTTASAFAKAHHMVKP